MFEEIKTTNNVEVNFVKLENGNVIQINDYQRKILELLNEIYDYSGFDSILESWEEENEIDLTSIKNTKKSLESLIESFYKEIASFTKIIESENGDMDKAIRKALTETVIELQNI